MLDSEDASEKGISVEKLKSQRAKLLAKNKKMLAPREMCQLSDEMTSDEESKEN